MNRSICLIIVAGKNYGGGSSRDTAAKAPWLAGIRAVIAQSFERIHRSSLISVGIAPLQFQDGVSAASLDLDGSEIYDLYFGADLAWAQMKVHRRNGATQNVNLILRQENETERTTFRHGGLLPLILRETI